MSSDTSKRAVRRARSEKARSRKARVQQFSRTVQPYVRAQKRSADTHVTKED